MLSRRDAVTFFRTGYRAYLPHLSVDSVVFGFHDGNLKLLLLRWKGTDIWTLPGGYIQRRESVDAAARRVLSQRTGLRRIYLRQFHAFGGMRRKESDLRRLFAALRMDAPTTNWPFGRVVSIAYYALVDFSKVRPRADDLSDACTWHPVSGRPRLAFDHEAIVARALGALRADLQSGTLEASLLPARFTMPELQQLHEAILGQTLDRRNFQKRMLERGDVQRLQQRKHGGRHRAPFLYRFVASR
jgi:8-oxo-dGTP diphosphatase